MLILHTGMTSAPSSTMLRAEESWSIMMSMRGMGAVVYIVM